MFHALEHGQHLASFRVFFVTGESFQAWRPLGLTSVPAFRRPGTERHTDTSVMGLHLLAVGQYTEGGTVRRSHTSHQPFPKARKEIIRVLMTGFKVYCAEEGSLYRQGHLTTSGNAPKLLRKPCYFYVRNMAHVLTSTITIFCYYYTITTSEKLKRRTSLRFRVQKDQITTEVIKLLWKRHTLPEKPLHYYETCLRIWPHVFARAIPILH